MFALLETREESQPVTRFCEQHNIKEACYYYWLKKYREANGQEDAGFAAVMVEDTAGMVVATARLPGGALISLYRSEALSYIQPLLDHAIAV